MATNDGEKMSPPAVPHTATNASAAAAAKKKQQTIMIIVVLVVVLVIIYFVVINPSTKKTNGCSACGAYTCNTTVTPNVCYASCTSTSDLTSCATGYQCVAGAATGSFMCSTGPVTPPTPSTTCSPACSTGYACLSGTCATGCATPGALDTTNCLSGYYCNSSSNCVANPAACTAGCPTGYQCDYANAGCFTGCTAGNVGTNCASGYQCNPNNSTCAMPATCSGCETGYNCDIWNSDMSTSCYTGCATDGPIAYCADGYSCNFNTLGCVIPPAVPTCAVGYSYDLWASGGALCYTGCTGPADYTSCDPNGFYCGTGATEGSYACTGAACTAGNSPWLGSAAATCNFSNTNGLGAGCYHIPSTAYANTQYGSCQQLYTLGNGNLESNCIPSIGFWCDGSS